MSRLISVGLPVRNGESSVRTVIDSVLAQDHDDVEVVVCDNASTDSTEEICRELAAIDDRVVYHRHAENIGLLNNFVAAMRLARGDYFRWIGHDDTLAPNCLSRCFEVLAADERLILVQSQIAYELDDGRVETAVYDREELASDDPADRFVELLRLCNESFLLIDPLYALVRRASVAGIERRNMLREDQVFAAKMALAGPWAHVPEVLATRGWSYVSAKAAAKKLDVPSWNAHVETLLQCRELIGVIRDSDLDDAQRRRAYAAVVRLFTRRRWDRITNVIGAVRRLAPRARLSADLHQQRPTKLWPGSMLSERPLEQGGEESRHQ